MTTSGGIAGMMGYDVQSTVILELRPEGLDDLELRWIDPSSKQLRLRYCQGSAEVIRGQFGRSDQGV